METISYYREENNTLSTLKSSLSNVAAQLDYSNDDYDTLVRQIRDNYTLNDDPVAIKKIIELNGNIDSEINYIKNTVIPAIDARISSNNDCIAAIEAQEAAAAEEAARLAAEEEARLAAEAAAQAEAEAAAQASSYTDYSYTSSYYSC